MSKTDKTNDLLTYVNDVKPYSSKVLDVTEEYIHSETATSTVSDQYTIAVARDCNYNIDFFKPYDVVEAFTYTDNDGTVTQDLLPKVTQDYVVAKVNLCVDAVEGCSTYYSPGISPTENVYYIDFYLHDVNVLPGELAVGIIEYTDELLDLPWTMPSNNNQLIGYYPTDYGYKSDGNGFNNNVDTLFAETYTSWDVIRVEIDFDTARVNFYKFNDPSYDLMGYYTIDPDLKYCFAVSMKNENGESPFGGTTISLIAPPAPPPVPYANAYSTQLQNQVIICTNIVTLTGYVEVGNGAPAPTSSDVLWELLVGSGITFIEATDPVLATDIDPNTTTIYKTTYRYSSNNTDPKTFKVTFFDNTSLETFAIYTVNHTPSDTMEMNARLSSDTNPVDNIDTIGFATVTSIDWLDYNYDPLLYQGEVPEPVGGFKSSIQALYNLSTFPYVRPDKAMYIAESKLYEIATYDWEKVYQSFSATDDPVFTDLGEGTFRVDTLYKTLDDIESIEVVSSVTFTNTNPDKITNIVEEIELGAAYSISLSTSNSLGWFVYDDNAEYEYMTSMPQLSDGDVVSNLSQSRGYAVTGAEELIINIPKVATRQVFVVVHNEQIFIG